MGDIKKNLGDKVRRLRLKQGLSQEELGFRSGLHRTYISDIERGERNVSVVNVQKIAEVLGVSVSELFEG